MTAARFLSRFFFSFVRPSRLAAMLSVSISCFIWASPGFANVDSIKLQERLAAMSLALREQSYKGLLTYEYGGALESLKLTHVVRDGVEFARLDRLNGPAHQRQQSGLPTSCLPVADQLLRGLLKPFGAQAPHLEQSYHFYLRGTERIAGRQAQVIQVVPRDKYRHGYNLAIDEETALPLRAMIISNEKRVLERFQFVDLQTGDSVNAESGQDLQAPDAESPVSSCPQSSSVATAEKPSVSGQERWRLGWMPSGYVLSHVQQSKELGEVLMFTDGLSAFSVFVASSGQQAFDFGRAQLGATVAYIHPTKVDNQAVVITVVGEIPAKTAMRIAASVKPR